MRRASAFSLVLFTTCLALTALAACDGGDDDIALPPFDGSTTANQEGSVPEGGAMMGDAFMPTGDAGGDGTTPGVSVNVVKVFAELPDGVAVFNGEIFVSFSVTGAIVNVHPDGTTRPYAQLPVVSGKGKTLGLAFDAAGNLYAAHTASSPVSPVSSPAGIFKIPAGGTDGGTLAAGTWAAGATTALMKDPNGLAFDNAGNLYVTETTGSIFKIPAAGGSVGAPWTSDPKLGATGACPGAVALGANGIAFDATSQAVFVTNTERGAIVKVPIVAAGAAGPATDVIVDCAQLSGADGLSLDPRDHSFVVAVNAQNSVKRVSAAGAFSLIFAGMPLDSPASIVQVLPAASPESFFVTNSAATMSLPDGGSIPVPAPSVVKLTVP